MRVEARWEGRSLSSSSRGSQVGPRGEAPAIEGALRETQGALVRPPFSNVCRQAQRPAASEGVDSATPYLRLSDQPPLSPLQNNLRVCAAPGIARSIPTDAPTRRPVGATLQAPHESTEDTPHMALHTSIAAAVLLCAVGYSAPSSAPSSGPAKLQSNRPSTSAAAGHADAGALAATPASNANRASSGERVEIPAAEDKRTLVATYWAAKSSGGNIAPGVVLVHQPGGKRDDLAEVAVRLHKQGFAVLALDLRGHGESIGKDKPWLELTEDERSRSWTFALRDLRGGASWLAKQSGVHSSNVSLVGDRAGCTLVVRHATRDENVRAVVLLDPPREQLGFNLAKDIEALAGLPTLIAATKESQGAAQAIADDGERANDGMKYIEIAVFKGVSVASTTELDKTLTAQLAKFLADKAMAKKAK